MSKIRSARRWSVLVFAVAVLTVVAAEVASSQVQARPPRPDCGPTREWNCVVPGCPECPEILFEGTICEKVEFEQMTGRVCSPA